MAAAWVMALDFEPPKLCAVLAGGTLTRELVEASGEFTVNLPTVAMLDATYGLGHVSGHNLDKIAKFKLKTAPASKVGAPLVEGCVGWLECKVERMPEATKRYDLFFAEVVAAWADDRAFVDGEWRFSKKELRTIHHLSKGVFLATGERLVARQGR